MKKMLAAVLHDFGDLVLEEVPQPEVQNVGDVVVRIKSCGFCATDYKAIQGIRRNVNFPFIPGHEPSGVVEEIGPGVTHFKVGDEVCITGGPLKGLVGILQEPPDSKTRIKVLMSILNRQVHVEVPVKYIDIGWVAPEGTLASC